MNIKTHYLYGSKLTWRLSYITTDIDRLKKWFLEDCEFNSVFQLVKVFELTGDEISEYLPERLLHENRLSQKEINIVKTTLLMKSDFWLYVYDTALQKKELVI